MKEIMEATTQILRFPGHAAVSRAGRVRTQNQDRFWCAGGAQPKAFAVFDGMGGERQGDAAARIAAEAFAGCAPRLLQMLADADAGGGAGRAFGDAVRRMNDAVCAYAKAHRVASMGSTAAALVFAGGAAHHCNVGDSRVYRYRGRELQQLSQDHRRTGQGGATFLTQHLGVPEEEFLLSPHTGSVALRPGDRFLLCTDGLTDMAPDKEIASVFSKHETPADIAEALSTMAFDRGGKDNITVVVCEAGR